MFAWPQERHEPRLLAVAQPRTTWSRGNEVVTSRLHRSHPSEGRGLAPIGDNAPSPQSAHAEAGLLGFGA